MQTMFPSGRHPKWVLKWSFFSTHKNWLFVDWTWAGHFTSPSRRTFIFIIMHRPEALMTLKLGFLNIFAKTLERFSRDERKKCTCPTFRYFRDHCENVGNWTLDDVAVIAIFRILPSQSHTKKSWEYYTLYM